ncbi:MAG: hypothetical protein AB1512_16615 [Thermodesulfobacteriota bacterium]
MVGNDPPAISRAIIGKAVSSGATLAGIASVEALRESPSYRSYSKTTWPIRVKSVLVLALSHDPSDASLDWWDGEEGGSLGNRRLQTIADGLVPWIAEEFNIRATTLPYHVERGGVFLKDASVHAGLGIIGKNNLVVTPTHGPRIRLRAMFLEAELPQSGPIDFSPCDDCPMPCREACPQEAFKLGKYNRRRCEVQMDLDQRGREFISQGGTGGVNPKFRIKYCRACELACPVGKGH